MLRFSLPHCCVICIIFALPVIIIHMLVSGWLRLDIIKASLFFLNLLNIRWSLLLAHGTHGWSLINLMIMIQPLYLLCPVKTLESSISSLSARLKVSLIWFPHWSSTRRKFDTHGISTRTEVRQGSKFESVRYSNCSSIRSKVRQSSSNFLLLLRLLLTCTEVRCSCSVGWVSEEKCFTFNRPDVVRGQDEVFQRKRSHRVPVSVGRSPVWSNHLC